ncbi:NADPH oxidoreductase [Rhizobium sp. TH135]|uniref:NAD(P)H-dependent oxidoreductase n=1 Tax=Rhizobium sp. TH135 TaxID=2067451 RepID=UPI000C7A8F18|nr:NAD(P)H-dependent oxidoreductase [Rhizobium sp. TH135]PLK70269.1 NADPH oxidoreductase [Rhizobium sp. TH135]
MKILVLTAHPDLSKSQINRVWFNSIAKQQSITIRNLTEIGGPEMRFDKDAEQAILLNHDRIALQFPFYWYSSPPVMKSWMDQVLSYGFAYGPDGDKLKGKELLLLVSTGGPADSYHAGGYNNFSMDEFLKPFQQTAILAQMSYLRPFVFHGMARATLQQMADSAASMLAYLQDPELDPRVRQSKLLKELSSSPEQAKAVS